MQQLIIELQENQKARIRILNKAAKLKKGSPAFLQLKKECAELSARATVIESLLKD
jgi:hypothetical protein